MSQNFSTSLFLELFPVTYGLTSRPHLGFYSCSFKSFQDTVRAYRGIQLYSRCEISGAVGECTRSPHIFPRTKTPNDR
jgi:hypothetical protein